MDASDKPGRRRYDATRRQAAAADRRLAVVAAARAAFEEHGWSGARVRDIASTAGVSHKLVEALFHTKAALLQAAVDYAIRGDIDPLPMPDRDAIRAMEAAASAQEMLSLHARHLRLINSRSARIALAVEQAATADPAVARLWLKMNRNRHYAVNWATDTLVGKRGRRRGLTRAQIASTFWVAIDWNTYRTLTDHAGLDDDAYETWIRTYYTATLLPAAGVT